MMTSQRDSRDITVTESHDLSRGMMDQFGARFAGLRVRDPPPPAMRSAAADQVDLLSHKLSEIFFLGNVCYKYILYVICI